MPYVLPMITFIAIAIFAIANPNITGLAVQDQVQISSQIQLKMDPEVVMPPSALVKVTLDGKSSSMTIEDFIEKTGQDYSYEQGTFPQINYKGQGYTGDYTYTLDLSEFNLGLVPRKDQYLLEIDIIFNNELLSHSEEIVTVEE